MNRPLDGCTVVDLTTMVAAPAAGRLLADLGARVIKIEPPQGDNWRNSGINSGSTRFSHKENPIFDLYNNGKDMICLNLKTDQGMAVMHQLLEKADVFITNNRPASLERMGLDYQTLHKKFPRLIYGVVRGFGAKGPEAEKKAYDTTAFWARTGFLRDQAVVMPDGQYEPVNPPISVGDSYTGTILAMQILAALLQLQQTGEGQLVSASLYHVGIFAMASMIVKSQRPFGPEVPNTRAAVRPGSGAFLCADGEWIFASDDPFLYFRLAGREALCRDPRLQEANRAQNREYLLQCMQECIRTKTCKQWLEELQPYDTPCVRLAQFADPSEDPQAWENDFIRSVEYPTGYTHRVPTSPIEMEQVSVPALDVTKAIGQDTDKVLLELGYSPEIIAEMKASGAIR